MSEKNSQPKFSQTQAVEIVKRLYRLTPSELRSLPSFDDQNFYVASSEGGEYILKIMNSQDSKNPALIDVKTYVMSFLRLNGFPTQTTLPTVSGELKSLVEIDCGYGWQQYMVRMLTYLPGTMISKVPLTPQLLYETGKMAAQIDKVLQKLEHPHLSEVQRETFEWHLTNTPLLEKCIYVLDDDPLQKVVMSVIHQYKTSVIPKRSDFRKCINHGDLNDLNVLVQPHGSDGHRISGILDFEDLNSGYFIYELAITTAHMMLEHQTPVEVGGPVLAGWESVLPLNRSEKDCLYVLVLSRFCQALVVGRQTMIQNPENEEYLMFACKNVACCLCHLWELGKEEVEKVWFETAAQISDREG